MSKVFWPALHGFNTSTGLSLIASGTPVLMIGSPHLWWIMVAWSLAGLWIESRF